MRARSRRTFPEDEGTLPDVLGDAEDLEPTVEDWRNREDETLPQLEEQRLAEDPETDEPGVARTVPNEEDLTPQGRYRASVTESPEFEWTLPDTAFLKRSTNEQNKPDTVGQEKVAAQLIEALGHFGVEAKVIGMVAGPHITRYELRLAPGIKVAKVAQLKDDLAYALAASDIRILAPIPGKQAVGVEVPNARRRIVHLGDVLQDTPADWSPLTVWLGKDVAGRAIGADLAKMPHLLVAGTTGAGKSGCVNAMLASVLAARHAARGAARARRPQAGRAQPLRLDPAPAHAGDHEPAQGRHRAAEPRARDGAALHVHVARAHALADRAQQGPRRPPRGAAARTSCA